jgi:hypothetical protein
MDIRHRNCNDPVRSLTVCAKSRTNISLVTIVIGASLFTTWLYFSTKSRQQQSIPVKDGLPSDQVRIKSDEACVCQICKHKVSNTCLNENCACCILMKDNSVVGHSNNPLQ